MLHCAFAISSRRFGILSLLLAATAAVVAADAPTPADAPEVHFQRAADLRLRGGQACSDADAAPLFAEAAREFDAAASAFAARRSSAKDDPEWAIYLRCAEAEMLLRLRKPKDARDVLAPLLQDPALTDSPSRGSALFYHGVACYQLGDDMAAGRSLDDAAPFGGPAVGAAAKRLLARLHERADERAEALVQYEAIYGDYADRKKAAAAKLQSDADALENDPAEKARLTALAQGPPPDAVLQAEFAAGVLLYEDGRFDEAHDLFAEAAASAPAGPAADARLYQGCCEVQLKQFARAVETLSARRPSDLSRGAQALLWLGRAEAGAADPADPDGQRETLRTSLKTLDQAARCFQSLASLHGNEGDEGVFALECRDDALREQAEVHERLGEFSEAADFYAQLRAKEPPPERDEETLQRELSARTLAGDPAASEALAVQFEKTYPRSILTPEVQLRRGENAALLALKATPDDAARLNAEAARQFQVVLDKYPEFDHAPQARLDLAWMSYCQGDYEKARALLDQISPADRKDDLAAASYLLADCLIRTIPEQTDDAVAAGRAQEQLAQAAELLTELVAAEPYADRDPDALMRLGLCQRRLAALAAKDDERNALSDASRGSFERVLLEYPRDEMQPHAALERARWIRRAGDVAEAIRRVRPFASGSLANHPLAPLAVLHLGGWLCLQDGMAPEGVRLLGQCRRRYEKELKADPARAEWAAMLRYQHALALQAAGRFDEGRAILKEVIADASRPESAEARLAWGQGMLAEGRAKVAAADLVLQIDPPDPRAPTARADREEAVKLIHAAAEYLEDQARKMGNAPPSAVLQARLCYEAAWIWRSLIDEEVGAVRARLQEERRQQAKGPDGPLPDPPDVPLSDIPLQPAEKNARADYVALIAAQPDLLPLAAQARLELAELLLLRGEPPAAAVTLLKQALDLEPPPDLSARAGLRLADCLFTTGDEAAAMRQLDRVAALSDTSLAPVARYRAAAWVAGKGDWAKAVERLTPFRDDDALKNLPSVTDKALLLLGRAYAALGQYEQATQADEQLLAAFADSAWRRHAHYDEAQTLHRQKKVVEALDAYQRALADAPPEVAVRSQIQIGVCEIEMGRFAEAADSLLAANAPDDPEMSAFALAEAAHALYRAGRRDDAAKRLHECADAYPKSPWGELAAARLKKDDDQPPHALPEAARLLELETPAREPLDPLGEQQPPEPSVLEDEMDRACDAAILSRPLLMRPIPAPLLRLAVPEPFENRGAVRVRGFADVPDLPPVTPLATPGS